GGKPARTGRKRPKSDLKSMKIAARNKVDAHEAAKAASGRVIQMIPKGLRERSEQAESKLNGTVPGLGPEPAAVL
ncbi:hypothetical protein, partial [Pseudomonas aeruginosa]|uniref:hypothetical protein n=1 Tax=Pseudomonas aeruginosa TaxID=287 RepID=UPI001EE9DF7B